MQDWENKKASGTATEEESKYFHSAGIHGLKAEEKTKGNSAAVPPSKNPRFAEENLTPQQYLNLRRGGSPGQPPFSTPLQGPQKTPPDNPQGSNSKLYNAYHDGAPFKSEQPSVILQQFAQNGASIGVISTGDLRTFSAPDDAMLAGINTAPDIHWIVSTLDYFGIKVESADLAQFVYKKYGALSEMSADLIRHYAQSRNETLPKDEKITVTLEVKRQGEVLPDLGPEPKNHLIQFRRNGQLVNVYFVEEREQVVFYSPSRKRFLHSQLNDVAQYEGWQKEGPVSILHFKRENVLPLFAIDAPQQESTEDNSWKHQRSGTSTPSSLEGEIPIRPRRKMEKLDPKPQQEE